MEKSNRNALERFLGLFAEVHAGEGATVVLLFVNLFMVLMSYYIAKVVREAFILAEGGAELKMYLSAGQAVLIVGAVRLYAWISSKSSRKKLINTVNIFFTACLAAFYLLVSAETEIGIIFFLWIGMFNVMVVAQFWSFANDVYTPDQGKRLFAIVAFGASAGAVAGSYLPSQFIPIFGLNQLLLVAGAILLLSLILTNIIDKREGMRGASVPQVLAEPEPESTLGKEGAFKLVFTNKYLLMIAFLILLLNWVNTTGEYILSKTVERAAVEAAASGGATFSAKDFIGQFYADFFTVVNIAGVLIQLFFVSRILKYLGIRIAILVLPIIAFAGNLVLAVIPVLAIVRWVKTAENATDYSLNNTVRHALFLPTSREEKYKAKQAIDSFFHRAGDVLSALIVLVGHDIMGYGPAYFAGFNVLLVVAWLYLAFRIGQENKRLTSSAPAS